MNKEDCIIKYFLSNQAFTMFLLGIIYDSPEYLNDISDKKFQTGATIGIISNVILGLKEDLVAKKENLNFEPKVFVGYLEKSVEFISTKTEKGYKIGDYEATNASTLVAMIRNKIAHGDFVVDFDNNKILLKIEHKNVTINVDKLSTFIVKGMELYLQCSKKTSHVRKTIKYDIHQKNRTKPLKLKSEIKQVIKNCHSIDYVIESTNGKEVPKICLEAFNDFVKNDIYYKDKNKYQKYNDFLKENNCCLNVKSMSVKSDKMVEEIYNKIINTIEIYDVDFKMQIRLIEMEVQKYINYDNKMSFIEGNLHCLLLLDALKNNKSSDIDAIGDAIAKKYGEMYVNYDLLGSSCITMFNSLFLYSFDDVFKNNNEYTNKKNDGLDYGLLDTSAFKIEKIKIDDTLFVEIRNKNNSIRQKYEDLVLKCNKSNNDLEKVKTKNNVNAVSSIEKLMEQLNNTKTNVENDLLLSNEELNIASNFYLNNQNYLRNKAIIEGIRNSIAHGNYKIICKDSYENIIMTFEDIYEDNLTFKATVNLMDFIVILKNNSQVVINFLNNKDKEVKELK